MLLKLIRPYTRVRIPFISAELNVPEKDVEALLVGLILDARVLGRIDQVNQLLELDAHQQGGKGCHAGLDKSVQQQRGLFAGLVNKLC